MRRADERLSFGPCRGDHWGGAWISWGVSCEGGIVERARRGDGDGDGDGGRSGSCAESRFKD